MMLMMPSVLCVMYNYFYHSCNVCYCSSCAQVCQRLYKLTSCQALWRRQCHVYWDIHKFVAVFCVFTADAYFTQNTNTFNKRLHLKFLLFFCYFMLCLLCKFQFHLKLILQVLLLFCCCCFCCSCCLSCCCYYKLHITVILLFRYYDFVIDY